MIDDSFYYKPPGIKESLAAGGVVVRLQEDQILVALVKEGDYPTYILPKGSLEPGEELQETARREIEEEAGLSQLEYLADLGVQERLNYRRKAWKVIHYFLYITSQAEGQPSDPTHGYRCEWFPLDALPLMFWPEQKQLIEGNRERIRLLLLLNQFNTAFNRHNVQGMLALMTEDCLFENTYPAPDGTRYQGRVSGKQFWEAFFASSPQARIEIEEMFAYQDRGVQRWIYHWTDAQGIAGHVRGVDVFRFQQGKIAEKLSYVKG